MEKLKGIPTEEEKEKESKENGKTRMGEGVLFTKTLRSE